ncbi:hypothetical protein [Streptomyces goshikiensis]|uniref:hypothetical protein n=1 Tax=Streptomyces goshikiensis TaxID=1942 RepID=UPI00369236B8
MTTTIDTLATALTNTLGGMWKVTASFDRITISTPLCDRITITPLCYSLDDVRWAVMPYSHHVPGVIVAELRDTDVTSAIAASLRTLSYRHSPAPVAL